MFSLLQKGDELCLRNGCKIKDCSQKRASWEIRAPSLTALTDNQSSAVLEHFSYQTNVLATLPGGVISIQLFAELI